MGFPFSKHALSLLESYYMKDSDGGDTQNAFKRASYAYTQNKDLAERIYQYASKGWFMFSSPILSNAESNGMPISCFLTYVPDTVEGLIEHTEELRWMSVMGGGVGGHWDDIRAVSKKAPGPIPFLKTVDSDMVAYRQGSCYTPETEVMTSVGWVRFDALTEEHEVAQVENGLSVTFGKPLELVVEDHDGDILSIKTSNGAVDLMVTPNHSMVIEQKKKQDGGKIWSGKLEKRRADSLPRHADVRFHTSVKHSGGLDRGLTPQEKFLIAFQADGSNYSKGSGCGFHLKKERKVERLRSILEDCGYSYREVLTNHGTTKFYIHAPIVGDKTFSWVDIKDVSQKWGSEFLNELRNWDASSRGDGYEGFTYFSTDKACIDIVQAVASLVSRTSKISKREAKGNRKALWKLYIRPNQHLTLQKVNVEATPYSGKVYCATVSTGMLLVRRSGVVTVCGNTRKGSYAAYLDVSHPDILEFLNLRVPTGGDTNRKCFNINNAVNLTDDFMEAVMKGEKWDLIDPADKTVRDTLDARELWQRILEVRFRTGEPYCNFIDEANRKLPQPLKDKGLKIHGSNLCNEIMLPTGSDRSAVCCLSSLNLEMFDEWKDTTIVEDLIEFLDDVLQYFIENAPHQLEKAINSAKAERSLGLGTMGFHAYLQKKGLPFESIFAVSANRKIYSTIKERAVASSKRLAEIKGEYLDGVGSGMRNSHLLAIAPNANSAIILDTSPSIEPWKSNAFTHRTRAGSFLQFNKYLEKVLESKEDIDLDGVKQSIILNQGSVQHLDFLTDLEKDTFKTAFELDQMWIVEHASVRQEWICQGQSVNLFFPAGSDKNYVNAVHLSAWKKKLKGLYYLRTNAGVVADKVSEKVERKALKDYDIDECMSCQG